LYLAAIYARVRLPDVTVVGGGEIEDGFAMMILRIKMYKNICEMAR
jgi:hypothetical protein